MIGLVRAAGRKYKAAVAVWERAWDRFTPFLAFPPEIRRIRMLVAAGQNIDRLHSEAIFAHLCGAAPIPASSGKTERHRLNPGGNRDANSTLHMIAVVRLRCDQRTRDYTTRRTTRASPRKRSSGCLKRYIVREIYHPSAPT